MSFPRYKKYKPSGVEWLGDVPEHWALRKLKSVASFSGGGTPSRDNLSYWNGDIPWVSPKDMKAERIVGAEESITEEGLKSSASNLLSAGRVLMVVRSGILKHTIPVAINETAVALNQDMKALDFDDTKCLAPFFLRWVQGFNDQLLLAWAKQGATVESIEHSYLADTVIPLPDVAEQTQIAAFLDRETAKIDELVAEQRRLMELLKEKRQAVISHAVTQGLSGIASATTGLNPKAPMKPSGVKWLGDVPKHWEVSKLGRLISTRKGIAFKADDFSDDGAMVIKASDIKGLSIRQPETFLPLNFLDQYQQAILKTGDLVLSTVGSAPEIRTSAVGQLGQVPENLSGSLLNQNTVVFTPSCDLLMNDFLFFALQTTGYRDHLDLHAHGTANQASLNISAMLDFPFPLPASEEQDLIIRFLRDEIEKMNSLTAEAQRAIDLLQERRTALISAAVTGQIDVRG